MSDPSLEERPNLPTAALGQIDRVCDRFEADWRAGRTPRIEDALSNTPAPHRPALLHELMLLELEFRRKRGEQPAIDDYRPRFPADTGVIESAFASVGRGELHSRAGEARGPGPDAFPDTVVAPVAKGPDRVAPPETSQPAVAGGPTRSARPGDTDLSLAYVVVRTDDTIDHGLRPDADRAAPFAPGVELQGRYKLEAELGRGGFGVVYLARDLRLGRPVAVKVMLPTRAATTPDERARIEDMFAHEARLGAELQHPAIATIHDYGFHGPFPYMVFEYVAGERLRERLARRWLALDEAVAFVAPVAEALDYAHSKRVVHRDLKPENILVTERGQFKILDLGLARQFDRTEDWQFAGTPAYASPEQAAEDPSDGRADQYALAVILYEMLTGRRPFIERDPWRMLELHRSATPPHPRKFVPELPERVAQILLKALSKTPDDRFPSCGALAAAIGGSDSGSGTVNAEVLLEAAVHTRSMLLVQLDRAHLLLTPSVLWTLHGDEAREIPVGAITNVRRPMRGRTLDIRYRVTGGHTRHLRYDLSDAEECRLWHDQLQKLADSARQAGQSDAAAQRSGRPVPFVPRDAHVRSQVLAHLSVSAIDKRTCENSLQLRAAMIGADAVLPEEPDEASRLKKPRSRKGRAVIDADDSGWDGMPNAAGWLSSVAGLLAWSAGEAGLDERDAVRVSGVAVRAANRNDRLSLWTGTIRRQARTLGGWMLACVFLIMASGWPPSAWALVWFLMNLGLITFLLVDLWPICLALALRQRGTGRFLLPAALTFAGWGLTLAARALLQANSPIPGLATGPRWVVVFLLTFTLILATIAWRLGLRHGFIVRASDPKLLPKSFLNLSMDRAWAITFFYLLLGPSGIGLTLFVMVLHAIR